MFGGIKIILESNSLTEVLFPWGANINELWLNSTMKIQTLGKHHSKFYNKIVLEVQNRWEYKSINLFDR